MTRGRGGIRPRPLPTDVRHGGVSRTAAAGSRRNRAAAAAHRRRRRRSPPSARPTATTARRTRSANRIATTCAGCSATTTRARCRRLSAKRGGRRRGDGLGRWRGAVADAVRRRQSRRSAASAAPARRATRRPSRSICAISIKWWRWTARRAPRASRAAIFGPALEAQLQAARADAAAFSAEFRIFDARRLDRDALGRPLRHAVHAYRRFRGKPARRDAGGRAGDAAAAGLGRGAEPGPACSSAPKEFSGVITEAWMRLQDRPRFRAGRRREIRRSSTRRRGRCAR